MKNSKMVLLAAVLLTGTGTVLRAQESEAAGTKTIKKGRLSKETDLLARISYENVKHLRYPKPQKTPDWARILSRPTASHKTGPSLLFNQRISAEPDFRDESFYLVCRVGADSQRGPLHAIQVAHITCSYSPKPYPPDSIQQLRIKQ